MERTELKFLLSASQAAVLEARVRALLQADPHSSGDGSYTVRSLYFDTQNKDFYYDNLSGVGIRKKYRIRLYDGNTGFIKSEIKAREYTKIIKSSVEISMDDAEKMMLGKQSVSAVPGLVPACICEYRRRAYVYPAGNVRISFDSDICASFMCTRFLDGDYHRLPIMAPGTVLMEIKYDTFLPAHIKDALNIGSLRQTSFSKYCRSVEACMDFR